VHEDIVLYRVAEAPRSTTVLVAFMGAAERLMLDTPTFLQHLPGDTDVLVLRDVQKRGHLKGIPGVADDLHGVVAAVREAVVHEYPRILTIGTSMGGAAALYAAVLLGAERGVSVGGFPIDPVSMIGSLAASPEQHVRPSGSPEGDDRPQLVCVFAAENDRDRTGAERLADVLPIDAQLVVAGIDSHGVLNKVRKRGKLRELLTLLLNEHLSAGSHAWTEVVETPRTEAESSAQPSSQERRMPAAHPRFSRAARRERRTASELLVRIHLRTPMSPSIRLRISHAAYRRFGLILPETSRRRRKHGSLGTGS
jgi:pimeloyl-ACP methyl ester carboxylesterase